MNDKIAFASAIIAGCALVASAIGVYFTYRTMWQQRIHNVKSVMPILHVGQWDYENDLCVTIKNCGMGLAVVKKLSVKHQTTNEIRNHIYAWLPSKLDSKVNYSKYWTPFSEFVVQPGEIIDLIKIPIDDKIPEQVIVRESLRSKIGNLVVQLEYVDLYDNKMPIKIMPLTHFLREDNVNKVFLV